MEPTDDGCLKAENRGQIDDSFFLLILQLHGIDDAIDKSKKILTTMSRRITRNKWIVGSVIAALVITIILVLYFKLSR